MPENEGLESHLRSGWKTQGGVLLVLLAIANGGFCATVVHVFRTEHYSGAGHLRQMLVAALALNLLATALAALFQRVFQWNHNYVILVAGQLLLSFVPFVLVRVIRIPQQDLRLHLFGALYALLVYLHLAGLVLYAFSNVDSISRRHFRKDQHIWVFAVSLLIYGAISPWVEFACWPTADEPHYLLLTHSLLFDHDFDLANNYAQADYKRFYPVDIPRPAHHTVVNTRQQEVPVHDIGVSVLLVPGYALWGRLGAMLELNFFGALLALGIFELGLGFDAGSKAAMACWALLAFTSPVVVYTSQIYPEVVGAGLAVWAMVAHDRFSHTQQWRFLLGASSLLACLPWLSVRYWLILGPMLAVMGLQILVTKGSVMVPVLTGFALIILPMLCSLFAFGLFDRHWYQTAIPNAGYVLLLRPRPSLFTHNLFPGLPGLVFDRAFGLLATAPVYVLAIAGVYVLSRRTPWQAALLASPVVAYILFAAPNKFWYGGWAPPPRYIVTGICILAPAAAVILSSQIPRVLLCLLAGWSFFISLAFMAWPLTRYTYWTSTQSALSDFLATRLSFHFDNIFPSFIRSGRKDYLLCGLWLVVVVVCVWKMIHSAPGDKPKDERQSEPDALTPKAVPF